MVLDLVVVVADCLGHLVDRAIGVVLHAFDSVKATATLKLLEDVLGFRHQTLGKLQAAIDCLACC